MVLVFFVGAGPAPCVRSLQKGRAKQRFLRTIFFILLVGFAVFSSSAQLFSPRPLTLEPGTRQDIGPFFYREQRDSQWTFAVPPLFSYTTDPEVDMSEFDFVYPLLSYDRFGSEFRFHVFQVLSFSGGKNQEGDGAKRFTLFPFYFQQRSSDPALNYTALFPIYGHLQNRLFRDEIEFVLFPFYARTRKKDVVTSNYLYPVFHLRRGNAVKGWQAWPLVGMEQKGPTTRTNALDEIEILGGYEKLFVLWPFFLKQKSGLGTTNIARQQALLPLYSLYRSPLRDSSTYFWPFGLTITDDREKHYREVGFPWPLFVYTRGEGKRTTRIWPLFSQASNEFLRSEFYLWPIYKFNRVTAEPLDRERTRILFFLYSDTIERNTQTGDARRRVDFWPFFTAHRDFGGNEHLQVLSILEPLLPNNKSIERNYSPLWALWRQEKNARTGDRSQSLLWNLYRAERVSDQKKYSLFFGLFQYQSGTDGRHLSLLPFLKKKDRPLRAREDHSREKP